MPGVAIDTSVLIAAERAEDLEKFLPDGEDGPFYVPAHAAAEFLVGTYPPVKPEFRKRALQIYRTRFRSLVRSFGEDAADRLASLTADLKRTGQTMKWWDAAIAAGAMASGDKVLTFDADYDRLKGALEILRPPADQG